jgi:hypothetical protein
LQAHAADKAATQKFESNGKRGHNQALLTKTEEEGEGEGRRKLNHKSKN